MQNLILLTPNEVSDILSVNYRKVLEMILLGELPAIQIGRQYRVDKSELINFLKNNKVKGYFNECNTKSNKII